MNATVAGNGSANSTGVWYIDGYDAILVLDATSAAILAVPASAAIILYTLSLTPVFHRNFHRNIMHFPFSGSWAKHTIARAGP